LLTLNEAFPVLVTVTVCAALVVPTFWLVKVRLEEERLKPGPVPVPVRLTVWGLPAALSITLTEAVKLPTAAGVNVTLMVQLPLAATELPHVLVCAKSLGLAPVSPMLLMVRAAVPVLVRVMVCEALATPTDWLPKARLAGLRLA
jgi:hypothetical protein